MRRCQQTNRKIFFFKFIFLHQFLARVLRRIQQFYASNYVTKLTLNTPKPSTNLSTSPRKSNNSNPTTFNTMQSHSTLETHASHLISLQKTSPPPNNTDSNNNMYNEEKTSFPPFPEISEHFIVRNPLILLICCSEYKGDWNNLSGPFSDYKILKKLFDDFYGWNVQSLVKNVTEDRIWDFFDKYRSSLREAKRSVACMNLLALALLAPCSTVHSQGCTSTVHTHPHFQFLTRSEAYSGCAILTTTRLRCVRSTTRTVLYGAHVRTVPCIVRSTRTARHDGLIVFMCGHGSMGYFVSCDDPGSNETSIKKHKRISLKSIQTYWNNLNARKLSNSPKIFFKVACRGEGMADTLQIEIPSRAGAKKWIHPFSEMVTIYASMPGDAIYDKKGDGKGSYLVHTLDTILRNPKWRLETLDSIILR